MSSALGALPASGDDHRLHRFAAVGVARGDDAAFLDRRMLVHHRLHFGRPHLVAAGVDHPLQTVGEIKITVGVHGAEIAGTEKALAVALEESLFCLARIVPVALKHLWAVDHDFADLARRQRLQAGRIDHQRLGVEDRNAQALLA